MDNESPSQENFRDEYKLVFEGCKFFVSVRFIVVAFAMSIQSALLTVFNQAVKDNYYNAYPIFGVGMIFIAGLFIVELRTTSIFHSFLKRGNELEFQLGNPHGFFHRIDELSQAEGFHSLVHHSFGINLVYLGMFTLWVVLLVVTIVQNL